IVRFFEKIPNCAKDDLNLPDSKFIAPAQVICFNHIDKTMHLVSYNNNQTEKTISILTNNNHNSNDKIKNHPSNKIKIGKTIVENINQNEFEESVEKAKEHIRNGDTFQTVLSRRTQIEFEGDEFEMYKTLRKINPSPYMFYLDFKETKIIGSSPEMLVKLENNNLTTRPLAGTRPRSKDIEEDEKLKLELLLDEKERAEHIMLVDLHRNDMGRVSEPGSVKVTELMGVEKYSHVQHIVSNVESKLKLGKDSFDALKACFPAGTVSGSPKIRAMEIIDSLEKTQRGPYSGVTGYFCFSGNMDFAINIRTIFTKGNKAFLQAGAGIVADSIAENEYVETKNKMQVLVEALRKTGDSLD
ncbi:MAG: anthranilate synthase component I family protein, partial [Candidatus Diapherotrites archaeon]|nr:anthranilate synthase component I family protein [Candidatus Diapherotrites archaeon]